LVKKYDIAFVEADSPVTEPVTKFGGQPVWVSEPRWPLSREQGEQMQFICQVALDPELFGGPPGRVAYLFATGDDYVATNRPDEGENAVLVQPGGVVEVETVPASTGPSLYREEKGPDGRLVKVPCEYAAELIPAEDPEFASEDEWWGWSEDAWDAYFEATKGNKIGGTPLFLQADEFPKGGPWRLLAQLDSISVPFRLDFGDDGVGWAFLSEDGETGKFLWQCH
jgi:hypothetical protein